MENIKTFEQFMANGLETNEAAKDAMKYFQMMRPILQDIQKVVEKLDDMRGDMNDNYTHAEIKKMKGYSALYDAARELGKLKDKLNNTVWPDEK